MKTFQYKIRADLHNANIAKQFESYVVEPETNYGLASEEAGCYKLRILLYSDSATGVAAYIQNNKWIKSQTIKIGQAIFDYIDTNDVIDFKDLVKIAANEAPDREGTIKATAGIIAWQ